MRIDRLEVEGFKGIKRASLAFGPSLNVVYGPNDIGKSTLAAAIRAALLVPVKSSEAEPFASWSGDAAPKVVLTFTDGAGMAWRVTKTYGASPHARLERSTDGTTFVQDAKDRQVEEHLRLALKWGIPPPGGHGRIKLDSYLVQALLGEQTEVDAILARSLDGDQHDSGKAFLGSALRTLAQDPAYRRLFEAATRESEKYWTESGQARRSRTSPFFESNERVKSLTDELEAARQALAESQGTEDRAAQLKLRHGELLERLAQAEAALELARRRAAATQVLEAAQAAHAAQLKAQLELNRQRDRVAQLEAALASSTGARDAAEAELARAEAARSAAELALQAVEGGDSRAQLELTRARLDTRLSEARAGLEGLERRAEELARARAAARTRDDLEKKLAEQRRRIAELAGALERTTAAASGHAQELQLLEASLAYARFRRLQAAARESAEALEQAGRCRDEARALRGRASGLKDEAGKKQAEADRVDARLPGATERDRLRRLDHDRTRAESALGGGLSVQVRPRKELFLRTSVDDGEPSGGLVKAEQTLEAERRAVLVIGDLVEVEITGGAKETRAEAAEAKRRWKEHVEPALRRADVSGFEALEQLFRTVDARRDEARQLLVEARTLESRAEGEDAKARIHEQGAARGSDTTGLDELRAKFAMVPVDVLETYVADPSMEKELAARQAATAAAPATSEKDAARLRTDREVAQALLGQHTAALEALPSLDARALEAELAQHAGRVETARGQVAQVQKELDAAQVAQGSRAGKARAALEDAVALVARAGKARDSAREAERAARDAWSRAQGELDSVTRGAIVDPSAASAVVKAKAAVESEGPLPPGITDVASAERAREAVRAELKAVEQELYTTQGALTKTGGPRARERVAELEQALAHARDRERDLHVEAQSWRMLTEVLSEAHAAQQSHLGRALSAHVQAELDALSSSRYRAVELGPDLVASGVALASAAVDPTLVLGALSAGTRHQLATLLRLAVASALRSVVVLDDHLVHTDAARLQWFARSLRERAVSHQVIILTCRPADYLDAVPDVAEATVMGGLVRALDAARLITRALP